MDPFKKKNEAEEWLKGLSDNDFIFFANLCFRFYHFYSKNSDSLTNFSKKIDSEIETLKSTYEKKVKSLQDDICEKQNTIEKVNSQLLDLDNESQLNFTKIRKENEEEIAIYNKSIQNLEDKKNNLYKAELEKMRIQWESDSEQQKIRANNQIKMLQAEVNKKDETIISLQELNKLNIIKIEKHMRRVEKSTV
ncbi:uncharacterized protein LOC136089304 [Hydra vulgaris]|uniref:Uncharacterized protein LOC136089304 n=1 Tax=Hydra vulgaris TaxID=6087 RepID=A0ABM4DAD5_HYDVU